MTPLKKNKKIFFYKKYNKNEKKHGSLFNNEKKRRFSSSGKNFILVKKRKKQKKKMSILGGVKYFRFGDSTQIFSLFSKKKIKISPNIADFARYLKMKISRKKNENLKS